MLALVINIRYMSLIVILIYPSHENRMKNRLTAAHTTDYAHLFVCFHQFLIILVFFLDKQTNKHQIVTNLTENCTQEMIFVTRTENAFEINEID